MPQVSRRIAILAEGHFAPMEAKTAIGVLRYRPEECVAVLDSQRAGRTAADCVGAGVCCPRAVSAAIATAKIFRISVVEAQCEIDGSGLRGRRRQTPRGGVHRGSNIGDRGVVEHVVRIDAQR